MKKRVILLTVFILFFALTLSASLINVYKSGKLKLVPDPNFGKGTQWDIYFPQGIMDIAFAKDGSFFATGFGNKACHCVYKFDKNGKFIKKIGRKGRGPGDLYGPGDLSILDNKYLLVAEYATLRRISVFDLNGNFVKIIKTKGPVGNVLALKDNKTVILTSKLNNEVEYNIIYIKDIKTEQEKNIKIYNNKKKKLKGQGAISLSIFKKQVYIDKIGKDNFLCGFSGITEISEYDKNGKRLSLFKLNYKKIKIGKDEKQAIFSYYKSDLKGYFLSVMKRMYKNDTLFPEYKPYYRSLYIDSEKNILVFKNLKYLYNSKKKELYIVSFDVFTRDGKHIKEISFEPNSREGEILSNEKLWFKNGYIYYFDDENDDNFILRRVKIEK